MVRFGRALKSSCTNAPHRFSRSSWRLPKGIPVLALNTAVSKKGASFAKSQKFSKFRSEVVLHKRAPQILAIVLAVTEGNTGLGIEYCSLKKRRVIREIPEVLKIPIGSRPAQTRPTDSRDRPGGYRREYRSWH